MFPLEVRMYFPRGIDRREVHEWAEQNGYYHHSYVDVRFEYETFAIVQCHRCDEWTSVKKSKPESCTCNSCGYHFGTCSHCNSTIEFSEYDMKFVKKKQHDSRKQASHYNKEG